MRAFKMQTNQEGRGQCWYCPCFSCCPDVSEHPGITWVTHGTVHRAAGESLPELEGAHEEGPPQQAYLQARKLKTKVEQRKIRPKAQRPPSGASDKPSSARSFSLEGRSANTYVFAIPHQLLGNPPDEWHHTRQVHGPRWTAREGVPHHAPDLCSPARVHALRLRLHGFWYV